MANFTINNAVTSNIDTILIRLDDRENTKVSFIFTNKIEEGNSVLDLRGLIQEHTVGPVGLVWNADLFLPNEITINSITSVDSSEAITVLTSYPTALALPESFVLLNPGDTGEEQILGVAVTFTNVFVNWSIIINVTLTDTFSNVSVNKDITIEFSVPV